MDVKRQVFDQDALSQGGAFVAIAYDGAVRIERGFIRPEDEPPSPSVPPALAEASGLDHETGQRGSSKAPEELEHEDVEAKPLPEALIRDLSAHRSLALRLELGANAEIAMLAMTHALAARLFYGGYDGGSCLGIEATSQSLGSHASGIEDTEDAAALGERQRNFASLLPKSIADLWDTLESFDPETRQALFTHCAGLTVFAVDLPWEGKPLSLAAAGQLATAIDLDLTRSWRSTEASYFSRVTKGHILDAVREGVSEAAANQLRGAKKAEMASVAEELLAGTGWLPSVLRTAPKAPRLSSEAPSQA